MINSKPNYYAINTVARHLQLGFRQAADAISLGSVVVLEYSRLGKHIASSLKKQLYRQSYSALAPFSAPLRELGEEGFNQLKTMDVALNDTIFEMISDYKGYMTSMIKNSSVSNILLGREITPELLQSGFSDEYSTYVVFVLPEFYS